VTFEPTYLNLAQFNATVTRSHTTKTTPATNGCSVGWGYTASKLLPTCIVRSRRPIQNTSDVKSSRPSCPRGQNFVLGLENLSSFNITAEYFIFSMRQHNMQSVPPVRLSVRHTGGPVRWLKIGLTYALLTLE